MNWFLLRSASLSFAVLSRNAASASTRSEMSVLVPNHCTTCPWESRRGMTRVKNGRNRPSAPRRGNTMSKGAPVAIDAFHSSSTFGSVAGSCTLCQPQPSICSGVAPVYSYQRRLYQKRWPVSSAIHTRLGMLSANVRNWFSVSRTFFRKGEENSLRRKSPTNVSEIRGRAFSPAFVFKGEYSRAFCAA